MDCYNYSTQSKRYFSSNFTLNRCSNSIYSSLKDFFWWCCSWLLMYWITRSSCDWPYEKAPYPSCQLNFPLTKPLELIHLEELVFTEFTNSEIIQLGLKLIKIWIWSGIPPIANTFWFLPFSIPDTYLKSSSLQVLWITFCLSLTENTRWM